MRRSLLSTLLGALLAACSTDGGEKPEDAGGPGTHEDAKVEERDASAPREDASTGTAVMDAGGGRDGTRDAASAGDAGGARDAGQDGGALLDADVVPSADGGGSAGAGCAGKAYKLCEDFESANEGAIPSGWSYQNDMMSNRPTVATDQSHSGARSLRSANQAVGQARIAKSLSALGATASKHWGRVFYRVKSPPTLPPPPTPQKYPVLHDTLVALSRPSSGFSEWRVVDTILNSEGKHTFILNVPDDSCCGETGYDYTSYDGKWHCAEWYIDVAAQEFRFFYDGTDVKIPAKPTGGQSQTLTQVVLGWVSYQTTAAPYNQAWIDDLAIDDSRIGCQ